jgi:hypothetical protein
MGVPLSSRNWHPLDRRADPSRLLNAIRRAPCIAKNYGAILSLGRPFAETSNGKGAIGGEANQLIISQAFVRGLGIGIPQNLETDYQLSRR